MVWDYSKTEYQKQAKANVRWRLERMINYDLNDEKLDRKLLEKHLAELKIPENKRAFLELLLWNKKF